MESKKSINSQKRWEIVRDPIYGDIRIKQPTLVALIHTPEFNRLRNIFQTPSVSPIFPGATCTRFLHCLGAFYLVCQILNNASFATNISDSDKLKVKIACLLHDIGHGPLSHTFEEVNALPGVKFHHEKVARRFITNPASKIYQILRANFKNEADIDDIIDMINGSSHHPLAVLVNSQADTDRMDYLVRDNWFAGTGYGYVDSQFLVRNIRFDAEQQRVYFVDKAIFSLENYLVGRYHMHTQVYNHPVAHGFNLLFRMIMRRIFDLWQQQFRFSNPHIQLLIEVFRNNISYQNLLRFDDYFLTEVLTSLKQETDQILQFLGRAWTQRVFFCQVKKIEQQKKIKAAIKTKFGAAGLRYLLIIDAHAQRSQLLIYDHEHKSPILIRNANTGRILPISQHSRLIAALVKMQPVTARQQTVFAIQQLSL